MAPVTQSSNTPRKLSMREKGALVAEILTTQARAWRALRRHGLEPTLASLRERVASGGAEPSRADIVEAVRLGAVVRRVLSPLPVDSRCLSQSLVLCSLLARRGFAGELVIGVRPGEDFGAHAWVELDGLPLLPTGAGEFERLVAL